MDLKGTTNLDPKLKETYERVMGTSFNPSPPPAQQAQPAASVPNTQPPIQPPPVQPLHVTSVEEPQPAQPLPPTPPPASENHPMSAPEMVQSPQIFSSVNPFEATAPPPGEVLAKNAVVPGKKANHFVVIGIVIGGIIFFAVYAFIWAKVFGLF